MSGAATLGRRYAKALLELASDEGKRDKIGQDLDSLASAWGESSELRAAFETPAVDAQARRGLLEALASRLGLDRTVLHTACLLSDRRRMRHLPEVVEAYRALAEERDGRVRAEVITAGPMPDSYFAELQRTLEQVTGREVVLVRREDSELIGGVVAKVGDKVFDGSVRARLTELRDTLLAP